MRKQAEKSLTKRRETCKLYEYCARGKSVCEKYVFAEMSERPKEHDWKSCVPRKGTEGSNPSLCAKKTGYGFFTVSRFF